jgi:endonuclease/exonuclease/phosphatase family metal-dependent hydrolase
MAGLDQLLSKVSEKNIIVAGDFNASAAFDPHQSSSYQFEQITRRLREKGLHSLWHTKEAQEFGGESAATYYHQWKREQPFHIDFMFASEALVRRLKHFSIGDFDTWCSGHSDHVPLIADFD